MKSLSVTTSSDSTGPSGGGGYATSDTGGDLTGGNGTGASDTGASSTSSKLPAIPCEVRRDLFEYGGIFEGDPRKMLDSELAAKPPNFGLTDKQIERNMPGIVCGPGISANGWWRGGKETDLEYLLRVQGVAKWLWTLNEGNALIITHGKFLDTLLKVLLEVPDPLESTSCRSNTVFLHGGCAFSCLEFDQETKKIGVMYLNQPIIAESKLRTGHKIGGFSLKQW